MSSIFRTGQDVSLSPLSPVPCPQSPLAKRSPRDVSIRDATSPFAMWSLRDVSIRDVISPLVLQSFR